jgi:hypothetical protein
MSRERGGELISPAASGNEAHIPETRRIPDPSKKAE